MDAKGLETLLVVALVAALAPIIVAALPGPPIPQVVVLIFSGILIGAHGLGLADTASIGSVWMWCWVHCWPAWSCAAGPPGWA